MSNAAPTVQIFQTGNRFAYKFPLRNGGFKVSNGTWASAAYTRKVLLRNGYLNENITEGAR